MWKSIFPQDLKNHPKSNFLLEIVPSYEKFPKA